MSQYYFSVDKFEYTPECIIFDLLNIHLYHGWIIDPQDTDLQMIIDGHASSYNQLVEKMIQQRQSENDQHVRESNCLFRTCLN
jgi:ubiquitin carboxyl-terminal hydrolase MINDY-1/2